MPSNPNVGQRVAANWEAVVGKSPEDNINDDYWLINQLSQGEGFMGLSGGDFISGPIEFALNTTVASYSDLDPISTSRIDVFDRWESQWKEYAGTVVMSDLEADRNSGTGQVFPLLPAKLENLRNSFRGQLNSDMYGAGTGNNSKVLTGLGALVSSTPTSGTVQGIDRGSFTFWRNQQTAGTNTTSAFDNLRAAMRSIYNLSSNGISDQHPTFAVTTRTVFEGYEGLLLANERFTDKSSGDGSFKNEVLKFKGAKISYDNDCTSGALYFLNPKFLKLAYKKGSWMKAQEAIRPANQTADVLLIRTMCNLVTTNPRRLGVVTTIT
jgi:hypothetical protein